MGGKKKECDGRVETKTGTSFWPSAEVVVLFSFTRTQKKKTFRCFNYEIELCKMFEGKGAVPYGRERKSSLILSRTQKKSTFRCFNSVIKLCKMSDAKRAVPFSEAEVHKRGPFRCFASEIMYTNVETKTGTSFWPSAEVAVLFSLSKKEDIPMFQF